MHAEQPEAARLLLMSGEKRRETKVHMAVGSSQVKRFNAGLVSHLEFASKSCFFIYVLNGGRRSFY